MGESELRRIERRSEITLGFAMAPRRLSPDSETINNHTKQIVSLGKETEEKNKALWKLNKDLKDLQKRNDELKITVESKDDEIKALKEKINKLESEKKALETNLRSVEGELEAMRKEVIELQEANKTSEERNAALEMNVKKLPKKMDGMAQKLEENRNENSTRLHKKRYKAWRHLSRKECLLIQLRKHHWFWVNYVGKYKP